MSEEKKMITLYPSNWLYNAGVVGIIRVFKALDYDIYNAMKDDGTFLLDLNYISNGKKLEINGYKISEFGLRWLLESWEEVAPRDENEDKNKIKRAWGILFNVYYRGFFNANTNLFYSSSKKSKALIEQFEEFISSFSTSQPAVTKCTFCLREANATLKNTFTSEHSKLLGAASGDKGVPNSFWNMNKENSIAVCDYCSFILLSNHLSRIRLNDNTEIFINAPSFKIMYELNKLAKEVYGNKDNYERKTKREILAMSLVEYSNKINTSLGVWTEMNIEIVTKRNDFIEFFTLPYNVIKIITDRSISSILADLGEHRIYSRIIDEKYYDLIDLAQRLLKLSTKESLSANDISIINALLYQRKNKSNLVSTANKILKLYSLIEDKLKGN
ncbi:hypothetical protein MROS_0816 [Melioribacter roseus P3M-2]|uniref:CRISPR-associated protein CXXC-CXXC domain-containing protein n=1 Tax=Melioribacter roseus (strain DSM 23840 / JCM 17771 / VKM B-2668 / P3M-2) TaxID=1191523 RepID=I6YU39_MELRP|nr:Cas8a1 family CRISPR/Cas system-associated protein [Melioribacter roseus]AFN74057.1 hypothetical protein MROS_0816 [Melioribacter roseus P3M-2]